MVEILSIQALDTVKVKTKHSYFIENDRVFEMASGTEIKMNIDAQIT